MSRKSIRLKNYDYSQAGYYFVTICAQRMKEYFGDNLTRNIINKYWFKLPDKFQNIKTDEFIIMPNHIHGIIEISNKNNVGTDPCVCSLKNKNNHMNGINTWVDPGRISLPQIIQWFKTMTTNEYIKHVKASKLPPFDKRLWQRNYYERIIRNERELNNVRRYIRNNPLKWNLSHNEKNQYMG